MRRSPFLLVATVALVAGLVIGWLQYLKYQQFGYNGLDLGIYTQTVWSLAAGHGFASSIHDPSYLGDHVELWLLPISWLYRLWPSPLVLLWFQTLLIVGSAIPLAWLARRWLGSTAAIVVAVIYLLHPLVYNVAMYEFHGLIVALPLALWSIVAYVRQRHVQWLLALLFLLLVREDMPLLVIGWGIMAVVDRRPARWWWPALAAGLAWFLAAQVIIRHFSYLGQYKYLAFYGWLGTGYRAMLTFPFRHPFLFLGHFFGLNNWQTNIAVLATFGFLPARRLRYLWPVSLLWLQLMLLGAPTSSLLRIHYLIPYLPFLAWATFAAINDVWAGRIWPRADQHLLRPLVIIFAIIGPLYGQLIYGPAEGLLPTIISGASRQAQDSSQTPPGLLANALERLQPSDRVITTFNLLPAVASRSTVYSLNYVYLGRRQYTEVPYTVPGPIDVAVIDWQQLYTYQFFYRTTDFESMNGTERIERLLADNNLRLAGWQDSVAVYTRGGQDDYQSTERATASGTGSTFGPLRLLSAETGSPTTLRSDSQGFRQVPAALTWRAAGAVDQPLSIRFSLNQNGQAVWRSTRLLGQGVQPATTWKIDETWRTNYRLAVPTAMAGVFTLRAEVIGLSGEYRLDRWRTFVPVITKETVVGTVDLGSVTL